MSDLSILLGFGPQGWGSQLLAGLLVTMELAIVSFSLGTVIGLGGAAAKLSGGRLGAVAGVYTTLIRGLPEILVIFLLFYGGASALRSLLTLFGHTGPVEVSAFLAGAIALALVNGAYSTELFRGAILAVPKGQIEAGRALGMGPRLIFRRILVPQMMRHALPGLGNLWLVLIKDTSMVSVIGLIDLLRVGQIGAGSTRMPFTFYFTVALMFLAVTAVSMVAISRLEKRFNRAERALSS